MLLQMEQALSADDPNLVSHFRNHGTGRPSVRRLVVGGAGVLMGLALIVTAILVQWILLGAMGFALMVASVAHSLCVRRRRSSRLTAVRNDGSLGAAKPRSTAAMGAPRDPSFMQRLDERWDRRRDDGWR